MSGIFDASSEPFTLRLRNDILEAEAELRPLVRRIHYDPTAKWPQRTAPLSTRFGNDITISAHEARTLLRAAIPVPMTTKARHQQHAALLAALATFAAELHGLTIRQAGDSAIAAGLDLSEALSEWVRIMRWTNATNAAGLRWTVPPATQTPIMPLLQHRTSPDDPVLFSEAGQKPKKPRRKNRYELPRGNPQKSLLLPIDTRPKTPTNNQAHDQAHNQAPTKSETATAKATTKAA